ncbi:MAG: secretion protein [Candidatus Altiarchaeales archaeon ex4484_96]|nr:MAG: secretion protein [Candidatus Altiarchaeales archaeon ex4484_96]
MSEVLASYGRIQLTSEVDSNIPYYNVSEINWTQQEKEILDDLKSFITEYKLIQKQVDAIRNIQEKEEFLKGIIEDRIKQKKIVTENTNELVNAVIDNLFFGYGKLGTLMRDDMLEEIMINGVNIPIYVFHRKYGMCETNVKYEDKTSINEFIDATSRFVEREVGFDNPLLDGHLIDGSRINISTPPAAPHGPSITIRKFRKSPLTIIDLILKKTISIELAAFLWVAVEGLGIHPCNILVAGGSGAGKTTLLNALAMFIPEHERVVTVEDTLELNFEFLKNWVPLEGVPSLGKEDKGNEVTLEVLVENTLRMRPDRVIAGEVRGREAEPLFVAMDIGLNGSMGTIHSNNSKETVTRLVNKPMDVAIRMLTLLQLVVVLNRHYDREKGMYRRVSEVGEITGIEGDVVQIGEIYQWDYKTDKIKRTEYPILLKEKICKWCGLSKKELNKEIFIRGKILEHMAKKGIRERDKVIAVFREYHYNPQMVLAKFRKDNP